MPDKQYYWDKINELTRHAIAQAGGGSEFTRNMGIKFTRKAVSLWVRQKSNPSELTCWKVVMSQKSTPEARAWANMVLNIYTQLNDYEMSSLYQEVSDTARE